MAAKKKQEPAAEKQAESMESQETEAPSSSQVTYIVNGQRVDPNGNPVKG